ncbi:PspC domain-containing protein [Paenibacillus jilunlii]|uniref:Phage shock protein C (PspC) family protein n=1 Tax=Paenibacillus jilunlii TaxID=682956 RepID=A0A1G9LTJ1_9BACL|nr:PspC domain-containing protein [Paenibacillus jilunlii]KWX72376.1 phage-shock protein [Paenibacillus jilunlii]SDL65047.1 phage shock protein C (PspC) family protein [Paenibacillus jilunlii]
MKKLYRSESDKRISGVCGGLARYLNIDTTLIRLLAVATALFSLGTVVFLYILASILMPKEKYNSYPEGYEYY